MTYVNRKLSFIYSIYSQYCYQNPRCAEHRVARNSSLIFANNVPSVFCYTFNLQPATFRVSTVYLRMLKILYPSNDTVYPSHVEF